ncbi:MAG: peptidylprolyl isomerase [Cryomorphaceae bacterium]|nr:peptidyl-prolyl cis-trans isomerase [Flavobacteriales bacterium]
MKNLLFVTAFSALLCGCGNETSQSTESNRGDSVEQEIQNGGEAPTQTQEKESIPMEYVEIVTNKGSITLELDPNRAPETVRNFLQYVDKGFYDGTVFHRVISDFMIQGGGFTADGEKKETEDPIILESQNGLSNTTGTVAMARTNAPNSATAQFFINVKDNKFLDYSGGNPGYAVFGRVTSGMDVLNEIRQTPTGMKNGMPDWPAEDVVIEKIKREE